MAQSIREYFVYVGTYTKGSEGGIFVYRLSAETGALQQVSVTGGIDNPSFLAIHPSERFLYSVCEATADGKPGGAVTAFAINNRTGELTKLNTQSSEGRGPCHVSVDQTGKNVLVANYSGGSVAVLPIAEDGSLKPASQAVQHRGSSVDPKRQEGPHPHSIYTDPANRFVLVPDLGLDQVVMYRFDAEQGKLSQDGVPPARLAPGAGPRHLAFHPNGRFVYVINELDNTVTVFQYDADRGAMTELQVISTLPEGYRETSYCADIHVHPSGKFVYGSNRGHDSIAIFAVDEATGKLSPVGLESTQGAWPRNIALDPAGKFFFSENQNSDSIVTFRIDQATGTLQATGQVTQVPKPVCIKMIPVR